MTPNIAIIAMLYVRGVSAPQEKYYNRYESDYAKSNQLHLPDLDVDFYRYLPVRPTTAIMEVALMAMISSFVSVPGSLQLSEDSRSGACPSV